MTLRNFIKENRSIIDSRIKNSWPSTYSHKINDVERRLWVLNDEYLYNLARLNGVRL